MAIDASVHPAGGELSASERANRAVERGEALFGAGCLPEAIEAFELALRDDPRSTRARNDLGVVLHALGRDADALRAFDEVLRHEPADITALINKASILVREKRAIDAAACVRAALRGNPCDVDALELAAKLDLPRAERRPRAAQTREDDSELRMALAFANVNVDGPAPVLSIIATTCGKPNEVIELLDRLTLQRVDPRLLELVLVDDGAPEALERFFAGWSLPFRFEIVRREHGDPTDAWKLGVRRAKGRWSLLLRDGTLPGTDTLRAHLIALALGPNACATVGAVNGTTFEATSGDLAFANNLALPTELAFARAVNPDPPRITIASRADASADGAGPEDRPVFLLGCAYRCGSTFIQRLLSSSSHLFVWGENMALSELMADVLDREIAWRWESYQTGQWKNFEDKGLHAWIANLQPRGFPQNLRHALRAFYLDYYLSETRRLGRERWGFKELHHGARTARFLLDLFPKGRVVFVTRNPVDVLASVATTKWYDQVGRAPRVLKLWNENTSSMLAWGDPRALIVRYEKVVARPQAELARIAAHVAIPIDRFDESLISRKVRGFTDPPALGADELAALRDPAFVQAARAAGYDVLGHAALHAPAPVLAR